MTTPRREEGIDRRVGSDCFEGCDAKETQVTEHDAGNQLSQHGGLSKLHAQVPRDFRRRKDDGQREEHAGERFEFVCIRGSRRKNRRRNRKPGEHKNEFAVNRSSNSHAPKEYCTMHARSIRRPERATIGSRRVSRDS